MALFTDKTQRARSAQSKETIADIVEHKAWRGVRAVKLRKNYVIASFFYTVFLNGDACYEDPH